MADGAARKQRAARIQDGGTVDGRENGELPLARAVARVQRVHTAFVGGEKHGAAVAAQGRGRPDASQFALGFEQPLLLATRVDRVKVAVVRANVNVSVRRNCRGCAGADAVCAGRRGVARDGRAVPRRSSPRTNALLRPSALNDL